MIAMEVLERAPARVAFKPGFPIISSRSLENPPMERRKFGNTNLEVSAISLGCWPFGVDWWGHYTEDDALRMCQFAYDQGITYFDNGDAYGNGRAETSFARFAKAVGRDKIEIGGKFGYDFYSDPAIPGSPSQRRQDFSPK